MAGQIKAEYGGVKQGHLLGQCVLNCVPGAAADAVNTYDDPLHPSFREGEDAFDSQIG